MWVRDVMTADPVTVRPDSSTKEALRRLDEHSITSLPVVAAGGRLVGVVSEADLVRDSVRPDPRAHLRTVGDDAVLPHATRVEEVMNHHPVTVHGDLDLADAVEMITTTTVKSLPVVDDDGHVVGMLSRRDVVHVLARSDQRIAQQLDALFVELGVDWLVDVEDGVVTVEGAVGPKARALAQTAAGTVPGVVEVRVVENGDTPVRG